MAADYYQLLGVTEDATEAQIKAAWHKIARAHHPDVSSNTDSNAKFKAASEAYEVLSSPAKRRAYDAERTGFGAGLPPGLGGLEEIFGSFFGSPFASAVVRAQRYTLTLALREAAAGGRRRLTLRDGRSVEVDLPAGVEDGSWMRAGDAEIEIRVLDDPDFRVLGRDLFTTIDVPLRLALNGGELQVATLQGSVSLKIAPGTQNGTRLRLKGQGLPDPRTGARGDLYAQANLRLPPLDAALKRWAKRMPAS